MNDTNIILYKDIEFTNQNTIKFADKTKQTAYFNSKIFGRISQYEKIIVDSIAVSDYDYYQLQEVTYISTQRVIAGKSKTYYYRVIEIEYSNDGLTNLKVNLDTIQTYMFDYEVKNAAIIREHQPRWDKSGKRLISKTKESIDINEFQYKEIELKESYQEDKNIYAAIITTKDADTEGLNSYHLYGKIPKGFRTYITFFTPERTAVGYVNPGSPNDFKFLVDVFGLNDLARNPLIYDIYLTPYLPQVRYGGVNSQGFPYITGFNDYEDGDGWERPLFNVVNEIKIGEEVIKMPHQNYVLEIDNVEIREAYFPFTYSDRDYLKGLTHKDNSNYDSKVYNAQYSSIDIVSGLDERSTIYIDEFKDDIRFKYTINNDMIKSIYTEPVNYRIPYKRSVTGTNNSVAMISDSYLEFMNNNKHSIQNRNTSNIVKAVAGVGIGVAATIATGGAAAPAALAIGGSLVNTGINQAMNFSAQNAELRDLKNQPDKISSPGDVDFNLSNGFMTIKLIIKTPELSEIERLSNYFKINGYSSVRIGKLFDNNIRKNFNYIQAENMVITGNIPAIDKEELKQIYGAGIRLWHNPATFLNFEIDNDEVI